MASTESSAPTNGNYAQDYSQPAQQAPASEIPKDEVGWYFVEQYYTTLSKSPDRLYLFYNKRSQFVSGVEEEKVNVCVGQKPINERIKELDFKDTKVRVTNVDSQGSDANIVIQVIGEISNQGQPHKRFVQTFVLAEQTNGYFVLNDIFRYLAEEPEEEELQQEQAANGVEEPASTAAPPAEEEVPQGEVASSEEDLTKVDERLEEAAKEEPSTEDITGTGTGVTEEAAEAEKAPEVEEAPAAEETPKEVEAPAAPVEEEKPKDPTPTPAPAPKKEAAAPVAMPAGPPKPAAPRTWASLAASAHKVATPVVAAPAAQHVPKEAKAAAPAQPAPATPAQTPAPAREQSPAASQGEAGWQSVSGHKKEQSRVQNQAPAADADQRRAYIKNVYSQVQEGSLRAALSKFGEIEYLDLSRPKNAAFVDFKTAAGYQAALAANPHTVDGVELKVEERRQRPQGQFQGNFARGGGSQRGRGGPGGPRGGFVPGRGRGGAPRGRGAPQES
ncbi:hypothetical protein E8E12_007690 [Didymella heteroderae]|uniref:Uncharacterized protein n=1 Tax=Didymella heteroderae TaxID=1769908 RepID=A0A9P4WYU9_9PLEO|nr:hypothetical protein E8E12_007690 [Didymella heteroderae]